MKAVYGEVACSTARLEAAFGQEIDLTLLTAVVFNMGVGRRSIIISSWKDVFF